MTQVDDNATRVSRVDASVERLDARLADLCTAVDHLTERMEARFDELEKLIDDQGRWSLGLLTVFATMVTLLLAVSQLSP